MITGVHHVSFEVSDMERALRFYGEGFGFELLNDRTISGRTSETVTRLLGAELRVVHLRGHGMGLELIHYNAPPGASRAPRLNDTGSAHLCFLVDDIDVEMKRLGALAPASFPRP